MLTNWIKHFESTYERFLKITKENSQPYVKSNISYANGCTATKISGGNSQVTHV